VVAVSSPGFDAEAGASPAVLDRLPPAVHSGFVHAYAASLHTVFLSAVPIAAVAFLLTWFLQEVPLRETAAAPDQSQALAPTSVPASDDSADEVVRALSSLARREDRHRIYTELAGAAGLDLDPRSTWLLYRLDGRAKVDQATLAGALQLSTEDIHALVAPLTGAGLVEVDGSSGATVTPAGHAAIERLVAARRARLEAGLGSWADEQDARLAQKLDELARDLLRDPDRRHRLVTGTW